MHHELANPLQLVLVKVAWYGLGDGPREFYESLSSEAMQLGCKRHPLDPCTYLWFRSGRLEGIFGVTVDDMIGGGTDAFMEHVMEPLKKRFPFGKLSVPMVSQEPVRFTGRDICQEKDYTITVDQNYYVSTIEPIDIPRLRRREKNSPLTDDERTQLRGKAGELNWLQTVSRPDLAGAVSILQTSFGEPTVETLLEANRIVREAKANCVTLRIPSISMDRIRLVCTADSAWGNAPDLSSHMGYMMLATDETLDTGHIAPVAPLLWKSHKQKRKTPSTLAAEAQATGEGIGVLDWCKVFLEACVQEDFELQHWESAVSCRPSLVLTDCKSVFDSLSQLWSTGVADKRTAIDLAIIREALSKDVSKCRWIDTKYQLVDSLTKKSASPDYLRQVLREGVYQVVEECQELERRSRNRNRHSTSQ
eukprot:2258445-Amphidinium_carterae.2